MLVNSKKRFLNVVIVAFMLCLVMCFGTTRAYAMTQISKVSVTIAENSWEQNSNPQVSISNTGCELVPDSVTYSENVSSVTPGDQIVITCKIRSKENYAFKDNLPKSYFSISNGKYQNAYIGESGYIVLSMYYTVRGYADEPQDLDWDGTRATWEKVSSKVTYTLYICKGNSSTRVADDITGTSYDLSSYLYSSSYIDRDDVYFKVKAVPKDSYKKYLKASEFAESDYFDDFDDARHRDHAFEDDNHKKPPYNGGSYNSNVGPTYQSNSYWQKSSDGTWYYYQNGTTLKNCFSKINGKDYYFLSNGKMATSWQFINNNWYWFDPVNGDMYKDTWILVNGYWYYLRSDGTMLTGWLTDHDGRVYFLSTSGAMVTGWCQIDGTYHYFNESSGALER